MSLRRTILLGWIALAWATNADAQCRSAAVGPCTIELRGEGAPRLSGGSCADEAWKGHLTFELPEKFADGDANGWHEAVLELDLKSGCSCAVFRIHFEGEPSGHTVNIGDSPTNNGYGGDAWTTLFDAELMLLEKDLAVYGSELPDSGAESQLFGLRGLPLAGRILELEVCDQSVRFAIDPTGDEQEFRGFFNTYRSRALLSIRPSPEGADPAQDAPDAKIYAAFNRVIHNRKGHPARDRFGSGVRRIEVSLTP